MSFIFLTFIIIIVLVLLSVEINDPSLKILLRALAATLAIWLVARSYSSRSCYKYEPEDFVSANPNSVPVSHASAPKAIPYRFDPKFGHRGEASEFDVDWQFYNGGNIIDLYGLTGSPADTKLANRMVRAGAQAKKSTEIQSRANKYSYAKWFEGEFDQQENRIWWGDTDELYSHIM